MTLLALLSADPSTLALSHDGGASFATFHSDLTDSLALNSAFTSSLAVSVDGKTMYAGTQNWLNATGGYDRLENILRNGQILKSTNGGRSFVTVDLWPAGLGPILSVDTLQTDATGQHILAGVTEFGGYYDDNDAGSALDQVSKMRGEACRIDTDDRSSAAQHYGLPSSSTFAQNLLSAALDVAVQV